MEIDWADKLASSISRAFGREVKALELNEKNLAEVLRKGDILVNATSVGISPNISETPVPARLLKADLVVFDIVYNPVKTRLLAEAEDAGVKTIGGIDMLVQQGALAFEMWTGLEAPLEIMKEAAIRALKR